MPEATNAQMQNYTDQRLRPRSEQLRAVVNSIADDKAAIDDVYARAAGANPWADARTDPPRLLNQQDVLVYNAVISNLISILSTASLTDQQKIDAVTGLKSNWAVFQSACVRPVGG